MNIAQVEAIATQVRRAIEGLSRSQLPITMSAFPAGSCGDATLLLGTFFKDEGLDGFVYISAERGTKSDNTWTSHAWLARGALVVDITADQFPDGPGPVVVAEPSDWHAQFEVHDTHSSDLRDWSGVEELRRVYSRIRSATAKAGNVGGSDA